METSDMNIDKLLEILASKGRHGDTTLMHVSPEEIAALEQKGTRLTRNPWTGLPEAFSLGNFLKSAVDPAGLFTKQGSSNPLATLTSNAVNPGQLVSGVTPSTVQESLRQNPFGPNMSYFDVLGGGAFAANPDVRKYGRLAGSAIGAYFATPAIASELGGGAGAGAGTAADTAFVPSAASTVPAAGGDAATAAELYGGAASGAGGGVGADIGTTDYAALNAMGVPSAATGAATATGAPVGSTGTVGAEQAGAPVSSVSIPSAGGPGGVSTGAAHVPLPTSGGGGVTGISALDKTLATLKANWLPLALQGAGLGISASKGTQPIPNQAQFQGMGETASNAAIQDIQTAQAGQLSGPQQASLDQYIQQAKNQVRQYFSSIGQYDSTERIKAEQQVDQDAMAMKTQLIQQTMQNGISLMGAANTPLQTVANYQLGQDQALQQAIGRFVSGVGTTLGSQAGTPAPATKTTP